MLILAGAAFSLLIPTTAVLALAAGATGQARVIAAEIQRFLLFYAGVFALITLTAAVGAGLAATDRAILSPGRRVLAQAFHRSVSLVALSALATHIMLEVIAHRAVVADAAVPFLAGSARFYLGVGTLACDLFVLIIVTGILRRRFATAGNPWLWRALHGTAYLCWPLAVLHGLLAGRLAKPYVDWSYGACLAAAGLALTMRFVATVRSRDTAAQPVPERAASALYAAPAVLDRLTGWPAPPGSIAGPAVSRAAAAGLTGPPRRPPARALPPGRADRPVTAGEWPTWPQPADWPPPQEWHTGPQPAAEWPTGPQAAAGRQTGPQAAADRRAGPHPAQRPDGRPQEIERPGPGEPAGGAWR
ncbi:MAG TPA: hypothetical protein VGQ05_00270 [Streptosporangiaceae bacterium]|nr:hypothetical protein [Streptosporangiaceae bacterium]